MIAKDTWANKTALHQLIIGGPELVFCPDAIFRALRKADTPYSRPVCHRFVLLAQIDDSGNVVRQASTAGTVSTSVVLPIVSSAAGQTAPFADNCCIYPTPHDVASLTLRCFT